MGTARLFAAYQIPASQRESRAALVPSIRAAVHDWRSYLWAACLIAETWEFVVQLARRMWALTAGFFAFLYWNDIARHHPQQRPGTLHRSEQHPPHEWRSFRVRV